MIEILDRNLGHLAKVIKRDLGADIMDLPGAGAAGGLGAGLLVERAAERVMRLILINIQDA
jgi:glycerate kinase